MRGRRKIFGVGLNKTGPKSLSAAVEILGFASIHYVRRRINDEMECAVDEGKPFFSSCPREVRRADAYFDIRAIEAHFDVLDGEFPGSRFILHTRDLDDWLVSRENHVLRNRERYTADTHPNAWLDIDRDEWTEVWHRHHARVRSYFASRPDDLLEMDVPGGDGWERLAPFLERPVREEPFPFVVLGPHASPRKRSALRKAAGLLRVKV